MTEKIQGIEHDGDKTLLSGEALATTLHAVDFYVEQIWPKDGTFPDMASSSEASPATPVELFPEMGALALRGLILEIRLNPINEQDIAAIREHQAELITELKRVSENMASYSPDTLVKEMIKRGRYPQIPLFRYDKVDPEARDLFPRTREVNSEDYPLGPF